MKEVSGMDRGPAYIIQASILGDLLEVANCFVLRGRYEFGFFCILEMLFGRHTILEKY